MTADVSAWARERVAEKLHRDLRGRGTRCEYCLRRADALLAVLPELLTDERVVEAAYLASIDMRTVAAEDPTHQSTGTWQRWQAGLRAAAETLAGAS